MFVSFINGVGELVVCNYGIENICLKAEVDLEDFSLIELALLLNILPPLRTTTLLSQLEDYRLIIFWWDLGVKYAE